MSQDLTPIKPLTKLQKRLLFIIQRNAGSMSTLDIFRLNVRLGGEKEIEAGLVELEEAGLLKRNDKRRWEPTERGHKLVIPADQLTR